MGVLVPQRRKPEIAVRSPISRDAVSWSEDQVNFAFLLVQGGVPARYVFVLRALH